MRSSLGLDSRDTTNASAGMAGLVRGTGYRTRNVHPQLTAPETASVATAVGDALQANCFSNGVDNCSKCGTYDQGQASVYEITGSGSD